MSDSDLCSHQHGLQTARAALTSPANWLFRIRRCGSHLNEPRFNHVDMCHPSWGFYIGDRADMFLTHAGTRYPIHNRAITLIPPWLNFSYHFSDSNTSGHAYIHCDIPRLPSGLIRKYFHQISHITDPLSVQYMWDWARRCAQSCSSPSNNHDQSLIALEAHSVATLCWSAFARSLDSTQRAYLYNPGKDWERIQTALDYITQHLHQPISNTALAHVLSCSTEHCIRLFKKNLGQTPTQYIRSQRIEHVAAELLHSSASIESIAISSGFPNRHYMSRVFTRIMGISPAHYRRQ